MKRTGTLLWGIMAAALLTGCGAMPDLTQEETELISEYAVGVLLKYDTGSSRRLRDTSAYDESAGTDVAAEETEEQAEEVLPETEPLDDTEVIDVSQDENREEEIPVTIEDYYGIQDVVFQYAGYELTDSYPSNVEGEELYFAMDATAGAELLVLKFMAVNTGGSDITLNMIDYGARFRIAVNGESGKGALATMLLNDLQTYDGLLPAGDSVELVSIVEVPQGTAIDTIHFILRGNGKNAELVLE
ncbi:MAG: hypothetical protein LUI12_09665 [Clostridiales bacterium]|nr:hypothetical protein [Clostridiales bacterium]